MTNHNTKTHVTFRRAFTLASHDIDIEWPAGDYTINTIEETTTINTRHSAGKAGKTRFVEIEPSELARALALDRRELDRAENEGMIAQ